MNKKIQTDTDLVAWWLQIKEKPKALIIEGSKINKAESMADKKQLIRQLKDLAPLTPDPHMLKNYKQIKKELRKLQEKKTKETIPKQR